MAWLLAVVVSVCLADSVQACGQVGGEGGWETNRRFETSDEAHDAMGLRVILRRPGWSAAGLLVVAQQ